MSVSSTSPAAVSSLSAPVVNPTLAQFVDQPPTTDLPYHCQPVLGLIGMGEMGRMYAKALATAGWQRIHVCDLPENEARVREDMKEFPIVTVHRDGHGVARTSDWLLYSVEAAHISSVVKQFGPSTKLGAIVSGQTSVKAPEQLAFETYLPRDALIASVHSLHGPSVSSVGQPLVIIPHRAPEWAARVVEAILAPLRSRHIRMSYAQHDMVTANTQAVTHAAFLSMGTAWASQRAYPWEGEAGLFVGGIEIVKVNIAIRIYSNKWHVYAGLAILNPVAREQIEQFAKSATELFTLMISGATNALRQRVLKARDAVFGAAEARKVNKSITPNFVLTFMARSKVRLLREDILDQFQLGGPRTAGMKEAPANSHLSLLAMVDCWAALGINPFADLEVAATPVFRLWIGIAQTLFLNEATLERAVVAACADDQYRGNDLEFVVAARGWAQCISHGSFELYRRRFEDAASFFEPRFAEAAALNTRMITAVSVVDGF
ncbi:prephenate dehydrogenase [Auriculariales sp. MPI-PUGE-AT-0066]|nr:prephenate dehydrogenase [Auriculariales sp. MPI-PUGE-AT-0066]